MGDNKLKQEQLGMPFGTAQNQLRKLVLLDVLKRHGENICFRCGEEIKEAPQLSVEHKCPWLNVSPALFWDLENVAFAHLSCNCANGKRMDKKPIPHGTHSGYSYRGCRCEACTEAHKQYQREWKASSI